MSLHLTIEGVIFCWPWMVILKNLFSFLSYFLFVDLFIFDFQTEQKVKMVQSYAKDTYFSNKITMALLKNKVAHFVWNYFVRFFLLD